MCLCKMNSLHSFIFQVIFEHLRVFKIVTEQVVHCWFICSASSDKNQKNCVFPILFLNPARLDELD